MIICLFSLKSSFSLVPVKTPAFPGKKTFSAVFFPLLSETRTIGLLNQTGIGCFLNGEKKYKGFSNTNQ